MSVSPEKGVIGKDASHGELSEHVLFDSIMQSCSLLSKRDVLATYDHFTV